MLVVGGDPERVAAAAEAVVAVSAPRVVTVLCAEEGGAGGARHALEDLGDGCFALRSAPPHEAAAIASDATGGLLRALGLRPTLLVAVDGAPALAADFMDAPAHRAARAAAVAGVPAVALHSAAPPRVAAAALREVLRAAAGPLGGLATPAANCPRAHFPFPERARWAALGSAQLPATDDELAKSLARADAGDFMAADCWSLGGDIAPGVGGRAPDPPDPAALRAALRAAFVDADVLLSVNVPRTFAPESGRFASTRPGVVWHQEPVRAEGSERGAGGADDVFGRSLPLHRDAEARASADGATFVPQLNAAKVVADTRPESTPALALRERQPLPAAFTVGAGTLLTDASARGDVDALLAGVAAVSTHQVWPQSHALSLVDAAMVEALREDAASGLPAWLGGECRCVSTRAAGYTGHMAS